MQNVAIGKGNLCVQGQQGPAAIKAGRRKLSRKKVVSCCLPPEKYWFTFQLAVDDACADRGMSLKVRYFFTACGALQRLAEI